MWMGDLWKKKISNPSFPNNENYDAQQQQPILFWRNANFQVCMPNLIS